VRILGVEVPTCTYKFTRKYVQYLSYERDAFLEGCSARKKELLTYSME
jgi:hypothetical protein